jgi:hypothetical protein
MPTLKAIHICNSHQPRQKPKIAKEYVFANADRRPKKNTERTTKCKCHKSFRGLRGSEVRFNFSCNLIMNHPQSLTALTLDR